jgi:uncharacterized protein YcaQ
MVSQKIAQITKKQAKRMWLNCQRLDEVAPFGEGPDAVKKAVEHLGYVQIDTIHVIERSHHHILFNRIPSYHREDLRRAQAQDKSVFEYWTHALSYVPVRDYAFFIQGMKNFRKEPWSWFRDVSPSDVTKVIRTIRKDGALSIRDIEDETLVEKNHPWASKKPSKRALQFASLDGRLTVSERLGMLKKYEISERHFGWEKFPKAASEGEILNYRLDRALRSQGIVNLNSICYMDAKRKPAMKNLIESKVKKGELVETQLENAKGSYWIEPATLEKQLPETSLTHLLSPFDPLTIQRERLEAFFGYEHRFEAYLPKEKRKFGYFALPILLGDQIVGAIDLKTDRESGRLLIQKWTWIKNFKSQTLKEEIEKELDRFEKFQLAK